MLVQVDEGGYIVDRKPSRRLVGLSSLVLGVLVGLLITAAVVRSQPANAAAIRDVQGVPIEVCNEGESIYGTDFGLLLTADGKPLSAVSDDPSKLVMPDGSTPSNVQRIDGTTSFYTPKANDASRADVVFIVEELTPGMFAVSSVIACDYQLMHEVTGYQP